MVLPPFVAGWRVRLWVQVPPGACNLPITKKSLLFVDSRLFWDGPSIAYGWNWKFLY